MTAPAPDARTAEKAVPSPTVIASTTPPEGSPPSFPASRLSDLRPPPAEAAGAHGADREAAIGVETAAVSPAVTSRIPAEPPRFRGEPTPSGNDYRIGPEDVIRISVWENKELSLDVTVRPDGNITFPLINDVQAAGLTPAELSRVLDRKLREYIREPQVTVIVVQVNAPKIYIIGNVVNPGHYPLRAEMTVLQALSLAGGFTLFASPRDIRLVRDVGTARETRKINYYRMIGDEGEGNALLRPGDTIIVP